MGIVYAYRGVAVKLTKWELERIMEALDHLIERRNEEGRGARNLLRLRGKVLAYATKTGRL